MLPACTDDRGMLCPGVSIAGSLEHLYLFGGPATFTILAIYLGVVVYGGLYLFRPLYPKGLVKYDPVLRAIVGVYDWFQVMANAAVLVITALNPSIVTYAWRNLDHVDFYVQDEDHRLLFMLGLSWYFLKIIDLCDTVFFVLRGKFSHLTFLQVYHHASMVGMVWFSLNYAPMNQNLFYAALNSFVHVVLYSYYLLSTMGVYVKWKRAITDLQVLQFVILFLFSAYLLCCVHTHPVAFWYTMFAGFQTVMFLVLFGNFYVRAYLTKEGRAKQRRLNMSVRESNRHIE